MLSVKRVANKLSRDVRKFWLKINKVVAFKQKIDSDECRQKVGSIASYPSIMIICRPYHHASSISL